MSAKGTIMSVQGFSGQQKVLSWRHKGPLRETQDPLRPTECSLGQKKGSLGPKYGPLMANTVLVRPTGEHLRPIQDLLRTS